MCNLLPGDRMAKLLGVATLEPNPGQKTDQCRWTAPVTGGAGGQLSVSSGFAGSGVSGDPLTVGGLRAHKQYNNSEKSCAVTVITTGATDPAGEESIFEKGNKGVVPQYSWPLGATNLRRGKALGQRPGTRAPEGLNAAAAGDLMRAGSTGESTMDSRTDGRVRIPSPRAGALFSARP